VIVLCTTTVNIHKFYILPAEWFLCSVWISVQTVLFLYTKLTDWLHNWEGMCLLCGESWIFKIIQVNFHLQRVQPTPTHSNQVCLSRSCKTQLHSRHPTMQPRVLTKFYQPLSVAIIETLPSQAPPSSCYVGLDAYSPQQHHHKMSDAIPVRDDWRRRNFARMKIWIQ